VQFARKREVVGIAAGLICGAGMSARAAVLTYTYDPGTSFTLTNGSTGDLTGTFTINPASNSLSSDDVVITGGPAAGTYRPLENDFGTLVYGGITLIALFEVNFTPNLNSAPGHSMLSDVVWNSGEEPVASLSVTGGATLVPEPSTWAMMLLGFAGLGVLGYRQTGKNQAATA